MNNTVHALSTLPTTDGNFISVLKRTNEEEIKEAIEIMKSNGGSHKSRILACERELRKRAKNNG